MAEPNAQADAIDWNLTIWEGRRREQLRRWVELLDRIVLAIEEMGELAKRMSGSWPTAAMMSLEGAHQ